ncbi:MAG: isocitrate/isopropylmalate dehydrogenase family protein, partial [Armatimonadetes bacterium]|nr:isocitrate/isopropylmalate dehydrogenase family protein [Armatimonadota bacterium]
MHRITLIEGDGTGPEVVEAMRRCVEATGVQIEWEVMPGGEKAIEEYGTPLPQETLESIRR